MSILNTLEYQCYAYNRSKHPDMEPKRYGLLFENWKEYEKKYQKEKIYWDSEVEGLI